MASVAFWWVLSFLPLHCKLCYFLGIITQNLNVDSLLDFPKYIQSHVHNHHKYYPNNLVSPNYITWKFNLPTNFNFPDFWVKFTFTKNYSIIFTFSIYLIFKVYIFFTIIDYFLIVSFFPLCWCVFSIH